MAAFNSSVKAVKLVGKFFMVIGRLFAHFFKSMSIIWFGSKAARIQLRKDIAERRRQRVLRKTLHDSFQGMVL